jgi:hypothetical protein
VGLKTIAVDLWGGQQRGAEPNRATCIRDATSSPHRSLRELFLAAYAQFAPRCRAVDEPGVAVIAIDTRRGRPQGMVELRARVDRFVAGIVGRHDRCDLYLPVNDRMALRQLAIVVDPVTSWSPGDCGRYRVLDLRSRDGFLDEDERPLRGMRCEGPALLRCAGHALFMLPLGDPTDWPESAEDAWAYLPERVYFDELECTPRGSIARMPLVGTSALKHSTIIRVHGPRDTADRLAARDAVGMLELVGRVEHGTIRIGREELRDGVLLGRYPRCDASRLVDDGSLSRVHALLIQVDDTLLAIDTASRNGMRSPGAPDTRVIELVDGSEVELGLETTARWRWIT